MTDYLPFTLDDVPAVIDIECDTLASSKLFKEPNGLKSFICPVDCSKIPNIAFGVLVYHSSSSVC